jgi:hypothetical protein
VIALTLVAILGTYSRGALIALLAAGAAYAVRSRYGLILALAGVVAAILLPSMLPADWFERMSTIQTYHEDASFAGRVSRPRRPPPPGAGADPGPAAGRYARRPARQPLRRTQTARPNRAGRHAPRVGGRLDQTAAAICAPRGPPVWRAEAAAAIGAAARAAEARQDRPAPR